MLRGLKLKNIRFFFLTLLYANVKINILKLANLVIVLNIYQFHILFFFNDQQVISFTPLPLSLTFLKKKGKEDTSKHILDLCKINSAKITKDQSPSLLYSESTDLD